MGKKKKRDENEEPIRVVQSLGPNPEPDLSFDPGMAEALAHLKSLDWVKGETAWDWLNRNSVVFLSELAVMGLDREGKVTDRVKLEALKELISRPLPPRSVYEIKKEEGPLDRMTEDEVRAYIMERVGKMLPEPESGPDKES